MDERDELLMQLDRLHEKMEQVIDRLHCTQKSHESGSKMVRRCRFEELLGVEIERSQRYNRYCAAAIVPVTGDGPSAIMQAALRCLRETDRVGVLEADAIENDARTDVSTAYVAILMPETQREGGHAAMRRALSEMQTANGKYGLAVYPDDGTSSSELLQRAMVSLN